MPTIEIENNTFRIKINAASITIRTIITHPSWDIVNIALDTGDKLSFEGPNREFRLPSPSPFVL